MADAPSSHDRDVQWAKMRHEARRLIEKKPWLERPDWAARRLVYDPSSGGFLSYLMIAICLVIGISAIFWAFKYRTWEPLVATAIFFTPAGLLIYYRVKARFGRSECLLRSIPARIGGIFEGDIKVRLGAKPDPQARASLANAFLPRVEPDDSRIFGDRYNQSLWKSVGPDEIRIATGGRWSVGRSAWAAEQRIGGEQIQIEADGTWTIPVRIPIPSAIRDRELGPLWLLDVHVATAGPDYSVQFDVPVFDLADLPYNEGMS